MAGRQTTNNLKMSNPNTNELSRSLNLDALRQAAAPAGN